MLWGEVGNPSRGEILQADRKVDGIPQAGERACVKAWGFRAWNVSAKQQSQHHGSLGGCEMGSGGGPAGSRPGRSQRLPFAEL